MCNTATMASPLHVSYAAVNEFLYMKWIFTEAKEKCWTKIENFLSHIFTIFSLATK